MHIHEAVDQLPAGSALFLYRTTCARCRMLSALAMIASCGCLVRTPIDKEQVMALYEMYPVTRGKLALFYADSIFTGSSVIPGAVWAVTGIILAKIRRPLF